jgi:hypothetical protein
VNKGEEMVYLIERASCFLTKQKQSLHPRARMLTDDEFDRYNLDKTYFYDYSDKKQLYPFVIEIDEKFTIQDLMDDVKDDLIIRRARFGEKIDTIIIYDDYIE